MCVSGVSVSVWFMLCMWSSCLFVEMLEITLCSNIFILSLILSQRRKKECMVVFGVCIHHMCVTAVHES